MAIEIVAPGLGCTVQDQGRLGHYDVGIRPSGALDLFSALAANLLVGNDEKAGVLEAAYMGPQLRFTAPAVVAVTGATMPVTVGAETRPQWESFDVAAGDLLEFGFLQQGARIYIAVAGGVDVPSVLGSRSTYALGGFGGFAGRAVQAGDVLEVGEGTGRAGQRVPGHLARRWSGSRSCARCWGCTTTG